MIIMVSILTIALCQEIAFAQRGKVRPEWDLDGGHNVLRHDTNNDDMWSFLLIIGAAALFFLFYYIKEHSKRSDQKSIDSHFEIKKILCDCI